jgi:hypothetical protein
LLALSAVTLVTGGTLLAQKRPTLFVFVPSLVRARALVNLLEEALPGVEVVAFGRFADFMSAVETLRPSAALSLADALKSVGLVADLRGTGPGGTQEPYVVLTHKGDISLGNLASRRLGVVDVVGRRSLPELVKRLLSLPQVPVVRRVLKVGDLLPLLSVNLADAIVIPERMVKPLLETSRQELRVLRPPHALLGRAALAYPGGQRVSAIQAGMQRLSRAALDALGIDGWEAGK